MNTLSIRVTRHMDRRLLLCALSTVIAFGGALASPAAGLANSRAAHPNVAIEWNRNMLTAFATAKLPAPPATRSAAIVQASVFDAVNGIDRRYTSIHVAPAAPRRASAEAAAVSAAYTALVSLFPTQKAALDADYAASLASISDGDSVDGRAMSLGLAWGKTVAEQIVAWRSTDGFTATLPPYVIGNQPGDWQPTPPLFSPTPVFRTLATTTPFGLSSPSQFLPAATPALTSEQYTKDFNEVKAYGSATSTVRTAYQTETAKFWQLDTASAIWNRVADSLAQERHTNLLRTARMLALLNVSQADAVIAVWNAKNTFNTWRPVTAIAQAATDGNPDTSPEAGWLPLIATAVHQEYPSGHSGVSSAGATILASFFGENAAFTATSDGVPGAVRSFTNFSDAVAQVADARVFVGFHFRTACNVATHMGLQVANQDQKALMVRIHGENNDSNNGEGQSS